LGKKGVDDNLFSAGILKLFRSPGIDSKELISPAYVACRAVRQSYSYSVSSPHRLFKIPAQAYGNMFNDDIIVYSPLRALQYSISFMPCPNPQGFTNGADGIAFSPFI
jgi:hypothetical protein